MSKGRPGTSACSIAMSPSEFVEVGSKGLISWFRHSFSAGVALYADIRGELGGESGMKRFPSTICSFRGGVSIWCLVWLWLNDFIV